MIGINQKIIQKNFLLKLFSEKVNLKLIINI
jgi:hypothetical protein